MRTLYAAIVLVTGLVAAATANAELVLEQGHVRGLPPGQPNTAAYMTLFNDGEQRVTIVAAASERVDSAELHGQREVDGMIKMQPLAQLAVAPGQRLTLRPGGEHLMLLGLDRPLREGELFPLVLRFADGSQLALQLPVQSVLTEHAQHQHQHQHQHHH